MSIEENSVEHALKLALEALDAMMAEFRGYDLPYGSVAYVKAKDARISLYQNIAEAEKQEPVLTVEVWDHMLGGKTAAVLETTLPNGVHKLYTTPPSMKCEGPQQRKQEQCEQQLVPLDDEGFVKFTKARENATQQRPSKSEACRSDIKPLTDEQIDDLARTVVKGNKSVNWLARAIEAAHGIKE